MPELTQARVRELFDYSPESGDLIRRVSVSSNANAGDIAGSPAGDSYLTVRVDRKKYLVHRIIWLYVYGYFPDQIDHPNHIRSDNRLCNLRAVNNQENSRNRSIHSNNTSGCVGVYWHNRLNKWMAAITLNDKFKHLGYFTDIEDAISARKAANIQHEFHANHGS